MEKQVLAEVVGYAEYRDVEKVMCCDRVLELVPGETTATITLAAHGRELTVVVPGEVLSFLSGE